MKTLMQSNPHRRSAKAEEKALYISVMSSSAIEGIRAPFAKARWAKRHKDMDSLIAYWKRRSRGLKSSGSTPASTCHQHGEESRQPTITVAEGVYQNQLCVHFSQRGR